MSASKCKYFNSCPSATGWCAAFNAFNTGCIPFILAAYKNKTDELRAEAMKKVINTGGGSEFRPCYVTDAVAYANGVPVRQHERKALFHRYADKLVVVIKTKEGFCYPKFMLDEAKLDFERRGILPHGFDVNRVYSTVAIVEFEDGTVGEVDPVSVRFVPGLMNEYDFREAVMNETRNDADS